MAREVNQQLRETWRKRIARQRQKGPTQQNLAALRAVLGALGNNNQASAVEEVLYA